MWRIDPGEWCYYVAYRFMSGVIMWHIDSGVVLLCGI